MTRPYIALHRPLTTAHPNRGTHDASLLLEGRARAVTKDRPGALTAWLQLSQRCFGSTKPFVQVSNRVYMPAGRPGRPGRVGVPPYSVDVLFL